MTVPVKVLGDRVLVKPDVIDNAPETTASGIVLAKSMAAALTGEDKTTSVSRGTVIAIGRPRHPLYVEALALAAKLDAVCCRSLADDERVSDAAHLLRDLVRRQPCSAVGDDVLFSHDAGQQITLEGEVYILLHEDELLAIVEPEPECVCLTT